MDQPVATLSGRDAKKNCDYKSFFNSYGLVLLDGPLKGFDLKRKKWCINIY